jgi:CheY-like chemotaxis protein
MIPAVLLVDDEQSICSALHRTFKQNKYKVFEANSGQQALDVLNQEHIDVVISDQCMPGMKGTELLKIVKNRFPHVGRIMLSGHSDIKDLTEAINEASVNQFVAKPWNDLHLLAMAKRVSKKYSVSEIMTSAESIQHKNKKVYLLNAHTIENTLTKKQITLELNIKNDALELKESLYYYQQTNHKAFSYLDIMWPDFLRFEHKGIVNMAHHSGYLNDLFTWYLSRIAEHLRKEDSRHKNFVVDFFSHGFSSNNPLQKTVDEMLHNEGDLIFRIGFDSLKKECFSPLLLTAYRNNHSFLLDIGKRVIDVNSLESAPITYLEMDGRPITMNNALLTEKRLRMISDAKDLGIKTILSGAEQKAQRDYGKAMGFDIF